MPLSLPFPELEELHLFQFNHQCPLSRFTADHIPLTSIFLKLQRLHVHVHKRMSPDGWLDALVPKDIRSNLTELTLGPFERVEGEDLRDLLKSSPQLTKLDLTIAPTGDDADMRRLHPKTLTLKHPSIKAFVIRVMKFEGWPLLFNMPKLEALVVYTKKVTTVTFAPDSTGVLQELCLATGGPSKAKYGPKFDRAHLFSESFPVLRTLVVWPLSTKCELSEGANFDRSKLLESLDDRFPMLVEAWSGLDDMQTYSLRSVLQDPAAAQAEGYRQVTSLKKAWFEQLPLLGRVKPSGYDASFWKKASSQRVE